MTGGKLGFESIGILSLRTSHDACVIDQNTELLVLAQEGLCNGSETVKGVVVHLKKLNTTGFKKRLARSLSFLQVANSEKDLSTSCCKCSTCLNPDPSGCTSDDEDLMRHLAFEIPAFDDLGAFGRESPGPLRFSDL